MRHLQDTSDPLTVLTDKIAELSGRLDTLERPSGNDKAGTLAALPILASRVATSTGFGLAAGWNDYASATIPVPAGKTHATVMVVGGAAAVDMTSGGVTSANARLVINGVASPAFPSAKDAGASAVNNVMTANSGAAVAVSGNVTVSLQINPLNATAFPANTGNFASLTVIVLFTP